MMTMFAYIRVSTTKQGMGVSLDQQKRAIIQHAASNGMQITQWFEEKKTAAKAGRPAYTELLRRLTKGEADGVIIHKIDRSARNLRDWADLGDLIDQGINVQFAHDNIDLRARGGRLSADLQAVIAADYVRNLRDETIKGLYGRLKQGLYPFTAPIGYIDTGKGKPKEPHPVMGPLVREAFELYATGEYSLRLLSLRLARAGLRNRKGKELDKNALSRILHNPFYTGLIKIQRSGETFPGIHVPLVRRELFEKVARILDEKVAKKSHVHGHLFAGLIRCKHCARPLIGEKQKEYVYYRCHTTDCKTKSIREDRLTQHLRLICEHIAVSDDLITAVTEYVDTSQEKLTQKHAAQRKGLTLERDNVAARMDRLTDLVLDGALTQSEYVSKKESLSIRRLELDEEIARLETLTPARDDLRTFSLQKTQNLWKDFLSAEYSDKRQLINLIASNLYLEGKKLMVELKKPYADIAKSLSGFSCSPHREDLRKLDVECVICESIASRKVPQSEIVAEIANVLYRLSSDSTDEKQ